MIIQWLGGSDSERLGHPYSLEIFAIKWGAIKGATNRVSQPSTRQYQPYPDIIQRLSIDYPSYSFPNEEWVPSG